MSDHETPTHRTEQWVFDATDGICPTCLTERIATLTQRLAAAEGERDGLKIENAALEDGLLVRSASPGPCRVCGEGSLAEWDICSICTCERNYDDHSESPSAKQWRDALKADLQRVRGALKMAIQQMRQHDDDQDCGRGFFDTIGMIEAALTGPATEEGT